MMIILLATCGRKLNFMSNNNIRSSISSALSTATVGRCVTAKLQMENIYRRCNYLTVTLNKSIHAFIRLDILYSFLTQSTSDILLQVHNAKQLLFYV